MTRRAAEQYVLEIQRLAREAGIEIVSIRIEQVDRPV
jgi:hypothetical protein